MTSSVKILTGISIEFRNEECYLTLKQIQSPTELLLVLKNGN